MTTIESGASDSTLGMSLSQSNGGGLISGIGSKFAMSLFPVSLWEDASKDKSNERS